MTNLWVFDNDGTLYDDSETKRSFAEVFSKYAASFLGVLPQDVPTQLEKLKRKWDTKFSIVALMKEFGIDYSELVNNTYLRVDFGKCNVQNSDSVKRDVLENLVGERIVFTNNPSIFARRVLSHLGLACCFSDFIGMEETCFFGKPDVRAFQTVESRHRNFHRIILCDDSLENLNVARKVGWNTIWYRPQKARPEIEQDHRVISSFEELKDIPL